MLRCQASTVSRRVCWSPTVLWASFSRFPTVEIGGEGKRGIEKDKKSKSKYIYYSLLFIYLFIYLFTFLLLFVLIFIFFKFFFTFLKGWAGWGKETNISKYVNNFCVWGGGERGGVAGVRRG